MKELTPKIRSLLKEPMGKIVSSFKEPLITIGDRTTYEAIKQGKKPLLMVYDNMIQRKKSTEEIKKTIQEHDAEHFIVTNNAGTISEEAENTIKQCLEKGVPTKVEVRGEEDLLTIPCVIHGKGFVYYGQPNQGMVEVEVTENKKEEAKKIMLEMEVIE